ncbi:MAG: RNA methyltransferase [Phormidium sp. BM_Day4_Bin.17]|nr:RNA methyltransferase [Phormidium sp. BM_Day4_Bin.17]UCJ12908.1 MAG: RNA methyltransferase [Phormidium sp. PBR-2020]
MLTSLQNPLIKQLRKLQQTKQRRLQQQFLLEGTHLIEEASRHHYPLDVLCYTPAWGDRHPQLLTQLQAQRSEVVSEDVLNALATTVNPDGVIATAPQTAPSPPNLLPSGVGFALERLQDPGNLGTLIRTAVAAEIDGLWLSQDSVDRTSPKVLRASAGTWFQMPMLPCENLLATVQDYQQQGVQVVATCLDSPLTYWDVNWKQPSLILLGNEGAGLSPQLLELADVQVTIPISPNAESLNVAIAAALLAFEVRRQRLG